MSATTCVPVRRGLFPKTTYTFPPVPSVGFEKAMSSLPSSLTSPIPATWEPSRWLGSNPSIVNPSPPRLARLTGVVLALP